MISYPILESFVDFAEKKAKDIGKLRNSITKGDGNVAGIIGELIALKALNLTSSNWKSDVSYDYDIIDNDGLKWDVKTKRRTVQPKPYHNCSVADYNTSQKCDRYLFVSLLNLEEGFVLGWITPKEFYDKSIFYKKGEVDPTSPPHKIFKFTADCYNLENKYLNKL
jgi:hypothetical protein